MQNYVMRRKLKYFGLGHIKRHECLERVIYEGIVEGKKGRGRPQKRWRQDISDRLNWLNTTITEVGRHAQDRDAFRRAVTNATCRRASANEKKKN